MDTSARSIILLTLQAVQRLIGWSLMLVIFAFLVMFGLQFPHSPKVDEFGFIISLKDWANPLIAEVGSWVDAPWPAKSLSFIPLVMAFTIWLGKLGVDATFQTVLRVVSRRMKAAKTVSDDVLAQLEGRITADSEQAREELLKKYRDIEQALKSSRRKRCAFLSVDVAGSTEMKNNEEATAIAASFQAYEEMLREVFDKHGAWKTAWTPDGVMVCFLQLDLAVAAAQRILEALPNFNRRQNKLRTPFRVRCGINEGEVAIFEDSKLEKIADHTIDVAGHMQKHCRTNALWLGEPVFNRLKETDGFIPLERSVDGYKVYEWGREPIDMAAVAAGAAVAGPEKTAVAPRANAAASATNRIGRYEILGELGKGAMGVVYKAKDPQIGRTVAIKMILTGTQTEEELEEYKQRFYREAQTAGQMSHPGIVTIYDVSEDGAGQPYLVMEFVEGQTLDRLLAPPKAGGPPQLMDLKQTLNIAWQVADALDYAHKRNVIHRDIKPANILVTPEGKAKIADFGIAKMSGTQMTQTGLMVGTPAFMAPEQITGKGADSRSDIFAFGVMLYWMVTGRRPFTGSAITEVAYKVVHANPESPRELNANVPPGVEVILGRCLAKDPAKRYQSAGDVASDLEAVRYGRPVSSTPIPMSPTPAN